jgi:hypothetical protein
MTFVGDDLDPVGLERKSPTEAADIEEITRGMLAIQARAAAAGKRPLSRGTHAKGICLRAEFEVLDLGARPGDLALVGRLAKSIFAVPGTYPATVRFANADGGHRQDRWPDVRALSFAVDVPPGAVPGATRLDFSMNSAATRAVSNIASPPEIRSSSRNSLGKPATRSTSRTSYSPGTAPTLSRSPGSSSERKSSPRPRARRSPSSRSAAGTITAASGATASSTRS